MVSLLKGHVRESIWIHAWTIASSAQHNRDNASPQQEAENRASATRFADACLADFDSRFPTENPSSDALFSLQKYNSKQAETCQCIVDDLLEFLVSMGIDFKPNAKDSIKDNFYRIVAGKL